MTKEKDYKIQLCKNKNTGEIISKSYNNVDIEDMNNSIVIMGDDKNSFLLNYIKQIIRMNSSLYIEDRNLSIYNGIKEDLENSGYDVKIINLINSDALLKENLEFKDSKKIAYIINYNYFTYVNLIVDIRNSAKKDFYSINNNKEYRGLENRLNMILDLNISCENIDKDVSNTNSIVGNIDYTLYFEKTDDLDINNNDLLNLMANCNTQVCLNKEEYDDKMINKLVDWSEGNIKDKKKILFLARRLIVEIEEL